MQEAQDAQTEPIASNRSDEARSKRKTATLVLVALESALLIVGSVWYAHQMITQTGSPTPSADCNLAARRLGLGLVLKENAGNWSLAVSQTMPDLHLTDTMMSLFDTAGKVIEPMRRIPLADLDVSNWSTYKALYVKHGIQYDCVEKGDEIIISKAFYPEGSRYQLMDSSTILANGVLN